jgi:hypothetical protein
MRVFGAPDPEPDTFLQRLSFWLFVALSAFGTVGQWLRI